MSDVIKLFQPSFLRFCIGIWEPVIIIGLSKFSNAKDNAEAV